MDFDLEKMKNLPAEFKTSLVEELLSGEESKNE